MGSLAIFGIENDLLNLVSNLFVLFLVVVYVALVVWTYSDARRRISDPLLVGCATVAAFIPFFGAIVYVILRPPEFLEDARERELEMAAAEARLQELNALACPNCRNHIERDYLRCPACHQGLKQPCANCAKALAPEWRLCPYCEHQVGQPVQRRRPRAAAPPTGQSAAPRPSQPRTAATRPATERPQSTSSAAASRSAARQADRTDAPAAPGPRTARQRTTEGDAPRRPRPSSAG